MRIALAANSAWYLYNFRRNIAYALHKAGHDIIAIAPEDGYGIRLASNGIRFRHIPLSAAGTNPFREAQSILALRRALREERVGFVLSYTPKGNIYAGLAARGLPVRQIANISGLGRTFIKWSPLTVLVKQLYRLTLGRAAWVFFQNEDDRQTFIGDRLVDPKRTERIPGSGVDLTRFRPDAIPLSPDTADTSFLLIARMLWDKGVGEFVEAARRLRPHHPQVHFRLLGPFDSANPSAIPHQQIDGWVREGIVEYLGVTDDVRHAIAAADCIVLPSYREGIPRSLLEAAAMAKPVITTDSPGCRDVVEHELTGYLCRVRDSDDLAAKMEAFLALAPETRITMRRLAREKMEREFDEKIVIDRYLDILARLSTSA